MSWPTPQDYSEAVQNPRTNFADPELKAGGIAVTTMGLPVVASGSFASVYRIASQKKLFAIRCFLKDVPDQHDRYDKISRYVMNDTLPYTVDFQYMQRGVLVRGRWYPILKMDWVDGVSLDCFVRTNLNWKDRLRKLADQFKTMMLELETAGIAHGDLQHGNIMITRDGALRLVDYDGMFVPELTGLASTELGHRNYQHPARDARLFNAKMDNFSAWSIYTSLVALSHDPSLGAQLEACDECLLFRQSDYRYPLSSKAFHILEAHENEEIRTLAQKLRSLLGMPAHEIPYLSQEVPVPADLSPVNAVALSSPFDPQPRTPKQLAASAEENELDARRMWPSLPDYMNSLTNPARNFIDPSMHGLILVRDHGAIRAKGTDHGAVFRYHHSDYQETRKPDILVKVFLHADGLIEHRYKQLYTYLRGTAADLEELRSHFADFTFIADGLRVKEAYFPIVRMQRIKGPTLWEAVEAHRQDKLKMRELIQQFVSLMAVLESSGIIHGDIEPENIIVSGDRMVLVDYDLTTTPHGRALTSQIAGNRHYRHPRLPPRVAAPNDNFAAWLIYYSLKIIQHYPVIWNIAGAKPGRLLFHADDLKQPNSSHVFRMLRSHFSEQVRTLEHDVSELLDTPADEVKPLRVRAYLQLVEALTKGEVVPTSIANKYPYLPVAATSAATSFVISVFCFAAHMMVLGEVAIGLGIALALATAAISALQDNNNHAP